MGNGYPRVQSDDLSQLREDMRALAAQVKDLSASSGTQRSALVADLTARTIMSDSNSFNQTYSSTITSTSTGLSLSFTLDESRQVLILGSVTLTLNSSTGASVQGSYRAVIDGSDGSIATGSLSGNSSSSYPLFGSKVTDLSAGEHTVAVNISGVVSGTASVAFTVPLLTVMVLQKV